MCGRIDATSTTNAQFALILGICIEQNFSLQQLFLKMHRTGHTCLFIDRKETLDRTVSNGLRLQQRHNRRGTDTVVSSQCCSLGFDPVAIDPRLNALSFEIKFCG